MVSSPGTLCGPSRRPTDVESARGQNGGGTPRPQLLPELGPLAGADPGAEAECRARVIGAYPMLQVYALSMGTWDTACNPAIHIGELSHRLSRRGATPSVRGNAATAAAFRRMAA